MSSDPLERVFPNLRGTSYAVTSPYDERYNCIAWAAGDNENWWEPDDMGVYYWPGSAPRRYTVSAYLMAFESLGFVECETDGFEDGFQKVAIFAKEGKPTHATRQLDAGFWTSKIGQNIDISHELGAICGNSYGFVVKILKRPVKIGRS